MGNEIMCRVPQTEAPGIMIGNSLGFAWGSVNCSFDFNVFTFSENDCDMLKMRAVKWDDDKIYCCDLVRQI